MSVVFTKALNHNVLFVPILTSHLFPDVLHSCQVAPPDLLPQPGLQPPGGQHQVHPRPLQLLPRQQRLVVSVIMFDVSRLGPQTLHTDTSLPRCCLEVV